VSVINKRMGFAKGHCLLQNSEPFKQYCGLPLPLSLSRVQLTTGTIVIRFLLLSGLREFACSVYKRVHVNKHEHKIFQFRPSCVDIYINKYLHQFNVKISNISCYFCESQHWMLAGLCTPQNIVILKFEF
jgi:hypothetical protein